MERTDAPPDVVPFWKHYRKHSCNLSIEDLEFLCAYEHGLKTAVSSYAPIVLGGTGEWGHCSPSAAAIGCLFLIFLLL